MPPPLVYNTYDTNADSVVDAYVRALFSATAPLSYDNSTGVFSISQAGIASDGYLSQADWNTFNNKQNALSFPLAVNLGGTGVATFGGTNRLLYTTSADNLSSIATSNTSSLVTNASGVPAWTSGTTANRVLRTDGTTISFSQVALSTDVTGTLPVGNGGTGITSLANGELVFGNGGSTMSKLSYAGGVFGTVLVGQGPFFPPDWGKVILSGTNNHVTGTLLATNGGTGTNTVTTGDLLYGSAANVWSKLADVATGNALISGGVGVAPSWGKIGLTTHISGTLGVANGGTGTSTAFTVGSVVFAGASGVYAQDNANFFWDDTNNRLCVGTNTAFVDAIGTARLTASGLAAANGFQLPGTTGSSVGTIIQSGVVVFHTYGEPAVGAGNNIFIGGPLGASGNFTTTGIGANVGIGCGTLRALTTGTRNMAIGGNCLDNCTTGFNNCAVGEAALFLLTSGVANVAIGQNAGRRITSGSRNMAVGGSSLEFCTTGENNVGVGEASLYVLTTASSNVALGMSAGRSITTGAQNIFIGQGAGWDNGSGQVTPATVNNTIAIGYYAQVSGSNMCCIGSLFSGFELKVGINIFTPTARLHLPAGTATASTGPLKFTSGTLLTTAEAGSVEFLTDKAYLSITTGPARKEITLNDAALTSGTFPVATTNGRLTDSTFTSTNLTAGTYTPTLTNVANLSASTAYECQYMRVGNTVTVSGRVDVDPTLTATPTQLGISLPIASNLGAAEDCAGTGCSPGIAGQCMAVVADAANNRAELQWLSGDVTNQATYFTFTYQVI